jgi:hypothetical protein
VNEFSLAVRFLFRKQPSDFGSRFGFVAGETMRESLRELRRVEQDLSGWDRVLQSAAAANLPAEFCVNVVYEMEEMDVWGLLVLWVVSVELSECFNTLQQRTAMFPDFGRLARPLLGMIYRFVRGIRTTARVIHREMICLFS